MSDKSYELLNDALVDRVTKLRQTALDMYWLAYGLNDDDPYFGEQRNAEERLRKAREVLGIKEEE